MFQSSRVDRPQDASKAPFFVSLLSCPARSYLDAYKQRMLRPVSEVADMETPLGPAGRYVDPFFQHRHYVGFVRDLVKSGSVGTCWFRHRCQEGWCSKVHHRCACQQQTFFEYLFRTVAHRRGSLPC